MIGHQYLHNQDIYIFFEDDDIKKLLDSPEKKIEGSFINDFYKSVVPLEFIVNDEKGYSIPEISSEKDENNLYIWYKIEVRPRVLERFLEMNQQGNEFRAYQKNCLIKFINTKKWNSMDDKFLYEDLCYYREQSSQQGD